MSADLLKYSPEKKTVGCTPDGVNDALKSLGLPSHNAKNALKSCTANIQNATSGKRIDNRAYLDALQGSLSRNQWDLAKTLGLSSVTNALAAKEAAITRQNNSAWAADIAHIPSVAKVDSSNVVGASVSAQPKRSIIDMFAKRGEDIDQASTIN